LFLAGLDQVLFCVGLFIASGGMMFHVLVAGDFRRLPASDRRMMERAAVLALAAVALGVGLRGEILTNGSSQILFNLKTWRIGIATSLGTSALVS